MPVTPEAAAHVERLMEHIRQAEAGVIPRATPVDFVISDWPLDSREAHVWVGPSWPDVRRKLDEEEAHRVRLVQHAEEVEAGLIPPDSPPTWLRSDWVPDEHGRPGWFGPSFNLRPEAEAE